jgi:hypothetical protein
MGLGDLHAQDLQNCLCEVDKYLRAKLGEGKPKRRFAVGTPTAASVPASRTTTRRAEASKRQGDAAPIVQAALAYAARGWPIFPCNPSMDPKKSKSPLTEHGFKDATTDVAVITAWWERWPNALIGGATGHRTFCVDLDRKKGGSDGIATWEALAAEHGGAPETLSTTTPSTGRHLHFSHVDGFRNIPLDKLGPGIEIKAEGGYVILPPSRLADGRTWEANGCDKIADAPEWLCELIREYQGRRSKKSGAIKPEPRPEPNFKPKPTSQSTASAEFYAMMMGDAGKGTSTRPADCLSTDPADIDAALSRAATVKPRRPPATRSAVGNGKRLHTVAPGDNAWSRRFRDVLGEIVSDLGGPDRLSEGQRQIARRCALIAVECERIEGNAVAGMEIDLETYGTLTDRLGRAFQRLGLKRKMRDVTSLGEILREDRS